MAYRHSYSDMFSWPIKEDDKGPVIKADSEGKIRDETCDGKSMAPIPKEADIERWVGVGQ